VELRESRDNLSLSEKRCNVVMSNALSNAFPSNPWRGRTGLEHRSGRKKTGGRGFTVKVA
jgi:hypothetical protein